MRSVLLKVLLSHILVAFIALLASPQVKPKASTSASSSPSKSTKKVAVHASIAVRSGAAHKHSHVSMVKHAAVISKTISAPPLPTCAGLPPICPGIPFLVSQDVDPTTLNNFITNYKITFPYTCRFQQPPRCAKKEVVNCTGRCTP